MYCEESGILQETNQICLCPLMQNFEGTFSPFYWTFYWFAGLILPVGDSRGLYYFVVVMHKFLVGYFFDKP